MEDFEELYYDTHFKYCKLKRKYEDLKSNYEALEIELEMIKKLNKCKTTGEICKNLMYYLKKVKRK